MSTKTATELLEKRAEIMGQIMQLQDALHGSIVERYTTCQRPTCHCHKGKKHGPRHYLAINENGHQRPKYIRTADLDRARQGVANFHRIQGYLDRLTALNLEILRAESQQLD